MVSNQSSSIVRQVIRIDIELLMFYVTQAYASSTISQLGSLTNSVRSLVFAADISDMIWRSLFSLLLILAESCSLVISATVGKDFNSPARSFFGLFTSGVYLKIFYSAG